MRPFTVNATHIIVRSMPISQINHGLFLYVTHTCGVDYIRSTQNGSDSLMIISIAIARVAEVVYQP
jgi:hypothetical protein